jgi:ubiquinone/menaquinone biosynthesis C-methylase UbiE
LGVIQLSITHYIRRVCLMDTMNQNRRAWDKKVENESKYTKAVSKEIIEKSRLGDWQITVTTERFVPRNWFPASVGGLKVLCLASGGGQQGPILAAAGAEVTVYDLSRKQLEQDEMVAKRDGLKLRTIQGDMSDLHVFDNETFDLIVHPVSNVFVEDVRPVWKEAARVLKDNGIMIAGFTNPLLFIFDDEDERKGHLAVANSIPFSSIDGLSEKQTVDYIESNETIEFGHTLEDQIQGQIDAGFILTGFYEDDFGGNRILDKYIKTFVATRAIKGKEE